jgi:signal transduction histidine kinase
LNRKLAAVLTLLVILPLALLVWVGRRETLAQTAKLEQAVEELQRARLAEIDATIAGLLDNRRRRLGELISRPPEDAEGFRALARNESMLAALFHLDPQGELIYPAADGGLTEAESNFLRRSDPLWTNAQILRAARGMNEGGNPGAGQGWHTWHWDLGLHLLYWRRLPDGGVVGAEPDRSRLLADLIAVLPGAEAPSLTGEPYRIALLDADRRTIYQWGPYEHQPDEAPRTALALSPPLGAWTLAYFAPPTAYGAAAGGAAVWAGFGALGLAFIGLAVYFYRESTREIREAAERVNFVGQVSHELKTPLTNIRMYAELLERELGEGDAETRRDLDVIVSESRRLSRLIGNILTFNRRERGALRLHPVPGDMDEAVRAVVEQFRPLLESKGVRIETDLQCSGEAAFDRDVLDQILGNLLGNVEKYAAAGGELHISTRREKGRSSVEVADAGPGIAERERERIFQPFYRVSDKLTDGVAGTGLGLALARDLARLHGGDLALVPSEKGARFRLTIDHEFATAGGSS